eukprot:Lithocolla_globosa_v1_NODE_8634_length_798_cov_3.839838.p2 type:complete len:112 gc:universal NODE_8634_length_798_cov_3.839838:676-341(-)
MWCAMYGCQSRCCVRFFLPSQVLHAVGHHYNSTPGPSPPFLCRCKHLLLATLCWPFPNQLDEGRNVWLPFLDEALSWQNSETTWQLVLLSECHKQLTHRTLPRWRGHSGPR